MDESQIERYVQQQLKEGVEQTVIVQRLVEMGIDKKVALHTLDRVYNASLQGAGPMAGTPSGGLAPAVVGGLLAAVVGGGAWTLAVIVTKYEVGIIAWGIGALCGYGVLFFAKGERGVPYQVVAAVTSVIGIFIGKYGSIAYLLKESLESQGGELLESPFSPGMLEYFFSNIGAFVSAYDLLWMALAVTTAWAIPKVKPAPPPVKPAGDAPPPQPGD